MVIRIEFGRMYVDVITGFKGRAVGSSIYMTGCRQVLLVAPVADDGVYREGQWFDTQQIDAIGDEADIVHFDKWLTPPLGR